MISITLKAVTILPMDRAPVALMAERFGVEPISAFFGIDYSTAVFMIDDETARFYDGLEHIERITKADMAFSDVICFDVKVRRI